MRASPKYLRRTRLGIVLLAALSAATGCASTSTSTAFPPPSAPAAEPVSPQAAPTPNTDLPGITIHRDARYLDLDAIVIGHGCEWLELVACTPGSREHEALVTITAKPSDLHLALLLLGVEPGVPQTGVRTDAGWTIQPPRGDAVDLHFIHTDPDTGSETQTPVEAWVFDRATEQLLTDPGPGGWIFTGSRLIRDQRDPKSPEVYLADVNGTAISLVHFGDETLGRDTTITESNDGQNLAPHTAVIPPNGTPVRLRITRTTPPAP